MKRITSVCLIFLIGLFIFTGTVFAAPPTTSPTESPKTSPTGSPKASPTDSQTDSQTEAPAATATKEPTSKITFTDYTGDVTYKGTVGPEAVMLLDEDSGTILYKKNIDEEVEPASTTKIMTCLLALESGKLDETVTVSSAAANMGGSLLHVFKGEKIVLKDLINGMMMVSGNDAAVAVAEFLGGSIDGFADMMNTKATELGMAHTHFSVPHGMHADNHHTTARDMALLTEYAMKNPQFVQIVGQKSYTMPADNHYHSSWTVKTTNHLMDTENNDYYQYATGVKTGSTPAAGDCLVASATKTDSNNVKMNLICMIYKDKYNGSARWPLAKDIFDWGFDNFENVKLSSVLTNISKVQIPVDNAASDDSGNGVIEFAPPDTGNTFITLSKTAADNLKSGKDSIDVQKKLNSEKLKAPVEKGIKVGSVIYKSKATGEVIYTQDLITPRDVQVTGTTATDGQSPVATLAPTPPVKINTPSNNSFVWVFILIPVGLIVFLVVRLMMTHRNKTKFRKYKKPHYSYRIK